MSLDSDAHLDLREGEPAAGDPGRPGVGAARPRPPRRRRPRRPGGFTTEDLLTALVCAFGAFWFAWLVFTRFTSGSGWFGFLAVAYATFLVFYGLVNLEREGSLVAWDRLATVVVFTVALVVLIPLVSLIGYLLYRGLAALRLTFFVRDQSGVTPVMPSTAGGGGHAVIGTIEQVGLALLWSLPLGLAAAVFLNETTSRWRRPVRVFVDAMSGLPSVVAGLFIFATLILPLATTSSLFGFNGFMASLALALTMMPTITRTVEVVLRLVPDGLREASLALGASRARTVWSVVFPTARTGISTAVVLGIARAVGETAPLLFTAFGYDLWNTNPFSGPQESLPLFVYRNIRKPDVVAIERGFAGALVLMLLVLTLFAIARYLGRDRSKQAARRAARAARSRARRPIAAEEPPS